ncbi:MAG: hypothetical protein II747_08395 [Clostridia bacterium]|nr:hypothetical protein [Clostridia bacterium]
MKKIMALATAALLMLAAVPALAFTGHSDAPAMPSISETENAFFPVEVKRMKNEPEESSTPWGETTYTFIPMDADAPIAVGDAITFECDFDVPATIEGFSDEELNAIEMTFDFAGVKDLEIVTADGLDPASDCDYEEGFCYPIPGYENGNAEGSKLVIDAKLGSSVKVVVRGIATAANVDCENTVIIGQYKLPTHYSVGKVLREDDYVYAYIKDVQHVQIRGMKFFDNNGTFDHYYVCLNKHDFVRSVEERSVKYVEVGNEENVITNGEKFEALENAYNTYMDFFGFKDDGVADVLTESVFLCGSEPVKFVQSFEFGSDEPVEVTEEPIEPTDKPVDPTESTEPAKPTAQPTSAPVPKPPVTGAVSVAGLGILAVAAGAGIVMFRKKNN